MKRTWHNNGPKQGLYCEIVSDRGDVIETAFTKTAEELVRLLNDLESRADRDAELSALRDLARKHETDRDRADTYERDLEEIGKVIGCGHLDDGLAKCVSDVAEERDNLRRELAALKAWMRMATMSDSGRQISNCRHGLTRKECSACYADAMDVLFGIDRMREAMLRSDAERIAECWNGWDALQAENARQSPLADELAAVLRDCRSGMSSSEYRQHYLDYVDAVLAKYDSQKGS